MSILIRGMEMPKNCDKCRFQSALRLYCDAMPYNFCGNTDDIERPDWCPLVEIPTPHGRLIDADKLMRDIEEYHLSDGKFQHWVDVQQTVIEAEGSEE